MWSLGTGTLGLACRPRATEGGARTPLLPWLQSVADLEASWSIPYVNIGVSDLCNCINWLTKHIRCQSLGLTLRRRSDGCEEREQALTELCKAKPWASEEKIIVSLTTSYPIDDEGICPTGESNFLAKLTHYGSLPPFNITMATVHSFGNHIFYFLLCIFQMCPIVSGIKYQLLTVV